MAARNNGTNSVEHPLNPLKFHVSVHPSLEALLDECAVEAAYLGGSSSRVGPSHKTDLDLFLVTKPEVPLDRIGNFIRKHLPEPRYIVGNAVFLDGFGEFFKVLHETHPIDIFTNPSDRVIYNKMMEGNQIVFDRTGQLTQILERKDESIYLARRYHAARIDTVYYANLLSSKLEKGMTLPSVRSYMKLLHALADLSIYFENPRELTYQGLNEDKLIQHISENFGIDYTDLSITMMRRTLLATRRLISKFEPDLEAYLND